MRPERTALLIVAALVTAVGPPAAAQDFVPFDDPPLVVPPPEVEPPTEEASTEESHEAAPSKEPPAEETSGASWPTLVGGEKAAGTVDPFADPEPTLDEEGRRIVEEKLIDEQVEPIGASALAPPTHSNRVADPSNERPVPSVAGPLGLPNVVSARVGTVGSVRLGLMAEIFSMKEFLIVGDRNTRQALDLAVAWTPTGWLEAYASLVFAANSNTLSSPTLLQVQGDSRLGVKGVWAAHPAFSIGADLRLSLFPPIGRTGIAAAGFEPRLVSTFDLRPITNGAPIIFHLDFGGIFDGTGSLPEGTALTRVEEFALGVHRHNRLALGVGVEFPLPWVSPYVSWRLRVPLGDVTLPVVRDDSGALRTLKRSEVNSNVLGLGARVTAVRDITFHISVDLGLTGAATAGVPATMPWNLMLGVSYAFDPSARSERVTRTMQRTVEVDKIVEPPTGTIGGIVRDADSGEPLGGALVTVGSGDGMPVASAMASGAYRTYGLEPGEFDLTAEKEGFEPVTLAAVVGAGQHTPLDFSLKTLIRSGSLSLLVRGGLKEKAPIAANVEIAGPQPESLTAGPDGSLAVDLLPGDYVLTVTAEGFLARQKTIRIELGGKLVADLELTSKPKRVLAVLRKNKIQLKRRVHFQTGKAEILPDSFQLLDQVIDIIVTNKINRVRVEGHTDSRGSNRRNLRLSQARAEAVATYLAEKGIAFDRVSAKGFGESKPIAPNLTKRGRAMNRRVEFHVVR